MRVKILNGSTIAPCDCCGVLLRHWENNSRMRAGLCSVLDCNNPAEIAFHVQLLDADDNDWYLKQVKHGDIGYIIPLCRKHKEEGEEYNVKKGTVPVLLEKTDLCKPQEEYP